MKKDDNGNDHGKDNDHGNIENKENNNENDVMASLVNELSELNRKISITDRLTSPVNSWDYLFGSKPSKRTSREEYKRYVVFMKTISQILSEFGIHMSNNGYTYIVDSVQVIYDRKTFDIRLSKDVYPFVALKYGYDKSTIIEHNIRNAIRSACLDNERKPGANRMGIFGKKPTNKEFLFYVADAVSFRMSDELIDAAC
ncbi:MAG: hypothetical protein IJH90_01905 [Mogibacterium sp.]|nr:hypothetical protein [Mogibacterium sp.]